MSFDLTVVFTGLTAFVENTCHNSRARMCALLVDGDPGRPSSFDYLPLRTHRAFVRFPINEVSILSGQLQKVPMDEALGVWYLRRDRIFFEIEEDPDTPDGANDFRVERMSTSHREHPRKPAEVPKEDHDSFSWVLDMQKVFPHFRLDPQLLSQSPPPRSVTAQIVIDRGRVATKSTTRTVWDFDPTLSGNRYQQVFAHEIMLSYTNLAAARMVAVSFDRPDRRKFLDLTALERGGKLEIQVINLCDCNPLQWPNDDDPTPDEDSKWTFELVAGDLHEEIHRRLEGRPLPIPRPIEILEDKIGGPGSGNCIPDTVPSTPFSFEELDGPDFECQED